ncbi:hypothetical protein GF314_17270 [bacterium]|nr:hypothetical protein [bacterium]
MRKIVTTRRADNHATGAAVVLLTVLLIAGCGGGDGEDQDPRASAPPTAPCPMTVDDTAMRTFYAMVDRIEAGEDVSLDDLGRLFAEPELDRWRRSFAPDNIPQRWLARQLHIALIGEEGLPERLQQKSKQADLIFGYREAVKQRERIETHAASLLDGETLCRAYELLERWAPAEAIPDSLPIHLVVGYPEIRYHDGHVHLDPGLAWAAGHEQLPRFLAALVYREIAQYPGRPPHAATGPAILLESLRVVHNHVVPSYVEQTAEIVFDPRHSLLSGGSASPQSICEQAYRTLVSLDADLTRVRGLDRPSDEDWRRLYRLFVGAQSFQATAWYFGQIIAAHGGDDRLVAAARHPADMIAAYQEAALATEPAPGAPEESLDWYLTNPPAFSPENARWLDERLRAHFDGQD